jgi:hypothetical protein
MHSAARRGHRRRSIGYPAYIDVGDDSPLRRCTVCEVSEQGAELRFAIPIHLPDLFTLVLSSNGAITRRCRIVRRSQTQVGVEFLNSPKMGNRPPRRAAARPSDSATAAADTRPSAEEFEAFDIDTLSSIQQPPHANKTQG